VNGTDNGSFFTVVVRNALSAAYSQKAYLTVNAIPTVMLDATSVIVFEGEQAIGTGRFGDADGVATVLLTATIGTIQRDDAKGTFRWTWQTRNGPFESQSVTITATDNRGVSATASFDLNVQNVAPTALDQVVLTDEEVPVSLTLTATDPGTDALSFHMLSGPADGVVSGIPPQLVYMPPLHWHGTAQIAFRVADSDGATSSDAFVTIHVAPVNDPPTIEMDASSVSAPEGGVAAMTGSFGDPEGVGTVALSATVGELDVDEEAGKFSWALLTSDGPAQSQTVTITAVDDQGRSANVAFDLVVQNVVPKGVSQQLITEEDAAVSYSLTATDPGDDIERYEIVTAPAHGVVEGELPAGVYTPAANWHGTDTFMFRAIDREGAASDPVAITIVVNPLSDSPTLVPDVGLITVLEGSPATLRGVFGDPDGNETVRLISNTGTMRPALSSGIFCPPTDLTTRSPSPLLQRTTKAIPLRSACKSKWSTLLPLPIRKRSLPTKTNWSLSPWTEQIPELTHLRMRLWLCRCMVP
jgi:hypothetical protein